MASCGERTFPNLIGEQMGLWDTETKTLGYYWDLSSVRKH